MSVDNRFSAQVVVVMVVAAAAWHLGVRSLHFGLAEARAEGLEAAQEIAAHHALYGTDSARSQDALAMFTQRENALLARSALSSDAAKIYEMLGAIASARNVRIDRIEPARGPIRDAGAAPNAVKCEAIGYSIDATGEYADLISFTDAVQKDLGVTKVLSIRIGPATTASKSRTMLSASIETAHYKLVVPAPQKPGKDGAK
jgi:Tfp pilus assembly protein PilO